MNKEERIAESMWNIIKELPCKQVKFDMIIFVKLKMLLFKF